MRAQGEANLERRFPILFFLLFSLFLAVIYAVVFWWIAGAMGRLVVDRARATARRLVDCHLLEYHLVQWETQPDRKELVQRMGEGLQNQRYRGDFLALDGPNGPAHPNVLPPKTEADRKILEELLKEFKTQTVPASVTESGSAKSKEGAQDSRQHLAPGDIESLEPVYRERHVLLAEDSGKMEYQYYQPVYWKRSCDVCHRALMPGSASSAQDGGEFRGDHMFRVVKISIPDTETRRFVALHGSRLIVAGLLAYLVTIMGTLLLLFLVGGRRMRVSSAGGRSADHVPAELAE